MFLKQHLNDRWNELKSKIPSEVQEFMGLNDPASKNFLFLLWEKQYWQDQYDHLQKKVHHGCTNGWCKECDPEEYKLLTEEDL